MTRSCLRIILMADILCWTPLVAVLSIYLWGI
jgi:hypothetical protein